MALFDHAKIIQVMTNLISNAIKFTPEGSTITVSIEEATLKKRKEQIPAVQVTVKDEGVGIPEDEIETVFDKFIQSSKTKKKSGGTGLGLAICREIIVHHGGKIWAENNQDGGATFSFMIPKGEIDE